jgi:acetylornithine/N-succinyldiaminopimelate aminotransferase
VDRAAQVVDDCRQQGLLVNAARPHCLRFMPALNSTAAEIEQGLGLLDVALHQALPLPLPCAA